jgi:hypothetical protein
MSISAIQTSAVFGLKMASANTTRNARELATSVADAVGSAAVAIEPVAERAVAGLTQGRAAYEAQLTTLRAANAQQDALQAVFGSTSREA